MIMKKICRRTKSARSSVMTLLAAAPNLPQNVIPANKPRSGRPPKTSKHMMVCGAKNYTGNITLVHQDLMIPSHRVASKTLLIVHKRKKRLQFTLRYLLGSVDDMKKVVWSDESTFQCISSNKCITF